MVYGADTQALGATFYPFYDFSYAMAGILSPAQWQGLYTGKTPVDVARRSSSQVTKWASLPKQGLHEQDVLTKTNILGAFMQGQGGDDRRRQLGHRDAAEGRSARTSRRSCRPTRRQAAAASSSTRATASRS